MKVLYETAPPRATITFNRPAVLNAFDHETLVALRDACEQAAQDDDVRVVVLTGAGRAFCVGADLRAWADEGLVGNEREYWKWFRAMDDAVSAIRLIGKPTVARINGICVGGGNEMQMACDLAVMVDDAFIRHVGLQHGSVPAAGATQWLPLIVGDRRAREIVMLCEEIPAAQALDWGLVNRVVPAADLDATVDELVGKLADRLPLMARYAKAQLDFFRDQAWYGTIRHAHDWLALSMLTEDAAAGVRGFLERRKED